MPDQVARIAENTTDRYRLMDRPGRVVLPPTLGELASLRRASDRPPIPDDPTSVEASAMEIRDGSTISGEPKTPPAGVTSPWCSTMSRIARDPDSMPGSLTNRCKSAGRTHHDFFTAYHE
jgi:hypothetical protein